MCFSSLRDSTSQYVSIMYFFIFLRFEKYYIPLEKQKLAVDMFELYNGKIHNFEIRFTYGLFSSHDSENTSIWKTYDCNAMPTWILHVHSCLTVTEKNIEITKWG